MFFWALYSKVYIKKEEFIEKKIYIYIYLENNKKVINLFFLEKRFSRRGKSWWSRCWSRARCGFSLTETERIDEQLDMLIIILETVYVLKRARIRYTMFRYCCCHLFFLVVVVVWWYIIIIGCFCRGIGCHEALF